MRPLASSGGLWLIARVCWSTRISGDTGHRARPDDPYYAHPSRASLHRWLDGPYGAVIIGLCKREHRSFGSADL
jgi:hypothetical protein